MEVITNSLKGNVHLISMVLKSIDDYMQEQDDIRKKELVDE